jgi:hypothetical protein
MNIVSLNEPSRSYSMISCRQWYQHAALWLTPTPIFVRQHPLLSPWTSTLVVTSCVDKLEPSHSQVVSSLLHSARDDDCIGKRLGKTWAIKARETDSLQQKQVVTWHSAGELLSWGGGWMTVGQSVFNRTLRGVSDRPVSSVVSDGSGQFTVRNYVRFLRITQPPARPVVTPRSHIGTIPAPHRGPTKGWILSYLTLTLYLSLSSTLDRHPNCHWPGS